MAEPLRKSNRYAQPVRRQSAQRQTRPSTDRDTARRRLVSRQIRSNASYRATILIVFVGIVGALLCMGFTQAYVRAGISRLNYEINEIRGQNEQILLESEKVRGQIAGLRSLDRIEEIASGELGMIKNEEVEYMILSTTIVSEGKIRATEDVEEAEAAAGEQGLGALKTWLNALVNMID